MNNSGSIMFWKGHGQGSTVEAISDEFAEYVLNLAATNIV